MKTFVVRLWIPSDAEVEAHGPVLRGFVDEVAAASTIQFVGDEQLVALLKEAVWRSSGQRPPRGGKAAAAAVPAPSAGP